MLELLWGRVSGCRLSGGREAYNVELLKLNSKDFGVAQNRQRVYIVGCRRDVATGLCCSPVRSLPTPPIRNFFDEDDPAIDDAAKREKLPKQITARTNILAAHSRLKAAKVNPRSVDMVVDIGSGRGLNMMCGLCPTITRSRGGNGGFWVTSLGRRLSSTELLRLQGVQPEWLHWRGIPLRSVGEMAGNAMTVPVLAAVLREALKCTGLAPRSSPPGLLATSTIAPASPFELAAASAR